MSERVEKWAWAALWAVMALPCLGAIVVLQLASLRRVPPTTPLEAAATVALMFASALLGFYCAECAWHCLADARRKPKG